MRSLGLGNSIPFPSAADVSRTHDAGGWVTHISVSKLFAIVLNDARYPFQRSVLHGCLQQRIDFCSSFLRFLYRQSSSDSVIYINIVWLL